MNMLAFPHAQPPVLEVQDLSISYALPDGWRQVVKSVSFTVGAGEVVALVGESGSGKTTTAQAVIGLLPDNGRIDGGSIRLNRAELSSWSPRRFDAIRGKVVSLIPQDPGTSLNPVQTIGIQVEEVLALHGWRERKARRRRVIELLTRVGLNDPELRYGQYPHELSGGMKQRVLIAIAIALQPALIIADEPTSALDVMVQKQVLGTLGKVQRELGAAVILIGHDMALMAHFVTRIGVMYRGKLVEMGPVKQVFANPQHSYTRMLIESLPSFHKLGAFRGAGARADSFLASGEGA